MAQTPNIDPDRASQQLRIHPDRGGTLNTAPSGAVLNSPGIATAPAGAETLRFVLQDVRLQGVTAYKPAVLNRYVTPYIGREISVADLYAMAAAMTVRYRQDGYILSQVIIPDQDIAGGLVTFQAVEGYIREVRVTGLDTNARQQAYAYAKSLTTSRPLRIQDMEHALHLIHALPGIVAETLVMPSADAFAAANLFITLQRVNWQGQMAFDNYGSRFLGPFQTSAALVTNSLFGDNERITLQMGAAPDDLSTPEMTFASLAYAEPIGPWGTMIESHFSYALTQPGYTLRPFDIKGSALNTQVSLRQPFILRRNFTLSGWGTIEHHDVETENNIGDYRHDALRMLRLGAEAGLGDSWLGGGWTSLQVEYSKGLDLDGASQKGDPFLTRIEGNPQAEKWTAELQRQQYLTSRLRMVGAIRGQFSEDALLSSEEIGLGGFGNGYGRGYDPSEVTGDTGVMGKIEVQWQETTQSPLLPSYEVYSFYDVGRIWNTDPTDDSLKRESLASVGGGVRLNLPMNTLADVTVATPLTRRVSAHDDKDTRVFFSLSKGF